MSRRVAAFAAVVVMIALAGATPASAQPPACRFVLGFATLRELVGAEKVGQCLEDERFNDDNGNAEQRTTGGLLVWRKADNVTAFTDGATTWINGPNGLQSRPNSERFSWERDPAPPAAARPGEPIASPPAPAAPVGSGQPAATADLSGMVLKLEDLPPGFTVTPDRTGATPNERVAEASPNPARTRTRLAELGRTGGWISGFERTDPSALVAGAIFIQSSVSQFATIDGARAYVEDRRAEESVRAQQLVGPSLGEETYGFQLTLKGGQAGNPSPIDLTAFRIFFRVGPLVAGVDYAGSSIGASIEEAGRLAQLVSSRVRGAPGSLPQAVPAQPVTPPGAGQPPPPPASKPSVGGGRASPQGTVCPPTHPIKGNKSSSGELIYHEPGGQSYARTQPEECFATAADAQADGYRASQR